MTALAAFNLVVNVTFEMKVAACSYFMLKVICSNKKGNCVLHTLPLAY